MNTAAASRMPDSPIRARWVILVGSVLLLTFVSLLVQIDLQLVEKLTPPRTLALILLDLAALVILMAYVVTARATQLWRRARTGMIGTRLQSRIVLMFCVVSILPTITVALFSAFFFNYGVKSWFDSRVSSALQDSVKVAAAYLEEHKGAIRSDALSMVASLQPQLSLMLSNPPLFREMLNRQIAVHNLSEAVIFDPARVLTRTTLSFSLTFERMPEVVLSRADGGDVVIFGEDEDKIQAVVRISNTPKLYLLISRVVDPIVLEHMESARMMVVQYRQLEKEIALLQKQFFFVFVLVALLVLLASVWAGMMLAVRLIDPLIALMVATERVRGGDYSIKVPEGRRDDEIANLGRTFNRMTGQLEAQRRDLMDANRELDERRRFIEAVLSGVSAGVMAIDADYQIRLCNRAALELLGCKEDADYTERLITDLLPAVAPLLSQAKAKPEKIASGDVGLERDDTRITLHVQVTAERLNDHIEGYIVTFDDITVLVSAQRSAAWADVARRIAHEIKNPLTPITLSAERLRKKFGSEITSDRDAYDRYLDTIGRHVKDIGRMVEEFVSFARMPTPTMREENLTALLRKTMFSEQTVHPEIRYTLTAPKQPVMLACDESQLRRMFTNLLKNAAEALDANRVDKKSITMTLEARPSEILLEVADNGPGFPPDKMAQLTEPYVTTRVKGTGLGLAIVKRTMEEHGGSIVLRNRDGGGAIVSLIFPKK